VVSARGDFTDRATAAQELIGATKARPVGFAPKLRKPDDVEREGTTARDQPTRSNRPARMDPLDDKLWGLDMVRADEARRKAPGKRSVTVGVMDTGLDASNPDLSPNFDAKLSRNFAPDRPEFDGPCEVPSCLDPVGTDDNGHGTHVAGTIGAAANGIGVSGVAPKVTLVELKAGTDYGYFFLDAVVNSLTHAADVGLDVVNMSFYVDPWLYNCLDNAADSPAERAEQRATIRAVTRALNYAHKRGVTLVGSLGNNHEDLGKPRTETGSPNPGTPRPRPIDNNTCWDLPVEGPHVIGVSAVGPSGQKADYSNYGTEQVSVAAPGGWYRDGFGTPSFQSTGNLILSSYPKKVLQEDGRVDAAGNVTPAAADSVFKDCSRTGRCGYYAYLQGTSMASPHVTGVAALIVSKFGRDDKRRPGLTMAPDVVEQHLYRTAAERACPTPRLRSYVPEGRSLEFDALCEGGENFNGFYGYGIVDAYAAVTTPLRPGQRP
jgi:subtilisin family serine protease